MSDKIVKEIEREDMNEKDKGKGDLYLGHVFPLSHLASLPSSSMRCRIQR